MSTILPEQLADQVYAAAKAAFTDLIRENPNQSFYAFGLWTNDSLHFLNPAANTEEALTATVQHYKKTVDPKYGRTSTRAGMRWSYGDWGFFPYEGGGYFDEINQILSERFGRMIDAEEYEDDSKPLWDAIQSGFRRLETEHFFGTGPERSKVTLLPVGNLPEGLVESWVAELNPSDVAEQYLNWDCDAAEEGSEGT